MSGVLVFETKKKKYMRVKFWDQLMRYDSCCWFVEILPRDKQSVWEWQKTQRTTSFCTEKTSAGGICWAGNDCQAEKKTRVKIASKMPIFDLIWRGSRTTMRQTMRKVSDNNGVIVRYKSWECSLRLQRMLCTHNISTGQCSGTLSTWGIVLCCMIIIIRFYDRHLSFVKHLEGNGVESFIDAIMYICVNFKSNEIRPDRFWLPSLHSWSGILFRLFQQESEVQIVKDLFETDMSHWSRRLHEIKLHFSSLVGRHRQETRYHQVDLALQDWWSPPQWSWCWLRIWHHHQWIPRGRPATVSIALHARWPSLQP